MVRTAAASFALMLAATGLATGAALLDTRASQAQPINDFAPECADESLDALTARGCRARALGSAEDELNGLLDTLRGSARALEATDRRRSALTHIDAAHNAWRLLRDHDCGLDAALAPDDIDAGAVQINCAIGRTHARTARLAVFLADTPVSQVETTTPAPTQTSAPFNADMANFATDNDVEHFRDWRASCRADGSCTAFTVTQPPASGSSDEANAVTTGAPHVFRLERPRRNAGWTVHLVAPSAATASMAAASDAGPANALDPDAPLNVRIDRLEPVVFQPGFDFTADEAAVNLTFRAPMKTARVFESMRAGLALSVDFTTASDQPRTDSFSLRGQIGRAHV